MTSKVFKTSALSVLAIIVLVLGGIFISNQLRTRENSSVLGAVENNSKPKIKIGVITDLSGPVAAWGNSTLTGGKLLEEEYKSKGLDVEFVFEDYRFEPSNALSAVQKLENIDKVDAYYVEFVIAANPVAEYLKDKNKVMIYDAANTSLLPISNNYFKSYIDYQKSCNQIAQKFKERGISKVGSLKANAEFGELCYQGISEIYPDVQVESYDLGVNDLTNAVTKMKDKNVQAIINLTFEAETITMLEAIQKVAPEIKSGIVSDAYTAQVKQNYSGILKDGYVASFRDVSQDLKSKLDGKTDLNEPAALGYLHLKQLTNSLLECQKEIVCTRSKIQQSPSDSVIGFKGFNPARIAEFEMEIKKL